jgi:hypothetical protein
VPKVSSQPGPVEARNRVVPYEPRRRWNLREEPTPGVTRRTLQMPPRQRKSAQSEFCALRPRRRRVRRLGGHRGVHGQLVQPVGEVRGRAGERHRSTVIHGGRQQGGSDRHVPRKGGSPRSRGAAGVATRRSRRDGARGTRTPDLLGAIQALSQLSYSPERAPSRRARRPMVAAHPGTPPRKRTRETLRSLPGLILFKARSGGHRFELHLQLS